MGEIIEQRRRYYSGLDADKASIPAGGKAIGDQYFATDTKIRYFWDGANWIALGVNTIDAGMIQTDAVETLKIKNLNVTTEKLALLAVEEGQLGALAVSAAKLKADAVETAKIKNLHVTKGKAELGFGRFVPRSPNVADFTTLAFTTDGTWKVDGLDLSGIVTAGATGVVLRVTIQDDAANSQFQIRQSAAASVTEILLLTQVANIYTAQIATLPIDANRLLDYQGSNLAFAFISISVLGWYI